MYCSATSSEAACASPRWRAGALLLLLTLVCSSASAGALTTLDEALALAFGDQAQVERESVFLSESELERARQLAEVEIERSLATVYHASDGDGRSLGRAWVDTHVVRTLPESLLVVLDPDGRVERVEVLVFREPHEYLPREGWYAQLLGRELDPELALKRGIRPITGATLTARATVEAVRRVLAFDHVLRERESAEQHEAAAPTTGGTP